MSTNYPYEEEQKHFRVPSSVRQSAVPGGRVLLREEDVRHRRSGNPLGKILVYEGCRFWAYVTPSVKALVTSGKAIEIESESAPETAETAEPQAPAGGGPAPTDVGSIFEDPKIVDALTAAGIDQVKDLVTAFQRGVLTTLPGLTAARRRTIATALLREKLISADEAQEA